MKVPSNYHGVLLFDDAEPKTPVKLSMERKAIFRQVVSLLSSNLGKNAAKNPENNRLVAVMITLLNLEANTPANVHLAYKFFRLYQLSFEGKLISCQGTNRNRHGEINLVGMDNFWKTTCYLDSLLVALFYSNSSFDYLLDQTVDPTLSPELQKQAERLKVMLRFITNLLRAGEHINIFIMYQLLLVLNSMGFEMFLSGKQQDSLQAFELLAESLSLPLLTLKLDIIHTGELSVNDDLRLIGERSLMISIPPNTSVTEPPITLEECLNSYFNNSITVRRHIDNKKSFSMSPMTPVVHNFQPYIENDAISTPSSSYVPPPRESTYMEGRGGTAGKADENAIQQEDTEVLLSDNEEELNEYKKLGILTSSVSIINKARRASSLANSKPIYKVRNAEDDISECISPSQSATTADEELTSSGSCVSSLVNGSLQTPSVLNQRSLTPSLVEYSPSENVNRSNTLDSSLMGSYKNFTQKLERQRTRSSTLTSVLNNVTTINPTRLTRRESSVSNTEVSLPAWMYLQLLPYYTDPEIKLTVENHEEYYRRRTSRSKTIESAQQLKNDATSAKENFKELRDMNPFDEESSFDKRFGNKRPVVPICLKRYTWNDRGQPVKNNRKVIIPEIIKYPYFIAEDRSKPGYVDFKRSYDHKAPHGSFMLVLLSCVCHRGSSINSGHYVTVTRKRNYDIYKPENKSDWLIFNDLEDGKEKVKQVTFDEAMEQEDPYLLFYGIYELDTPSPQILQGFKENFWGRKQSVVSGFSAVSDFSENTLQEKPNDELKITSATKHVMLGLSGLTLNKSRNKTTSAENDDVFEDYYWYDDSSLSKIKSNGSCLNKAASSNPPSTITSAVSSTKQESDEEDDDKVINNEKEEDAIYPFEEKGLDGYYDESTDPLSKRSYRKSINMDVEKVHPVISINSNGKTLVSIPKLESKSTNASSAQKKSKQTSESKHHKKKTSVKKLLKKVFS